jgi:hypothetical protein
LSVFERRALRQVDDHLQLGLVVEGQQLDRHVFGREQDADAERRRDHRNSSERLRPVKSGRATAR